MRFKYSLVVFSLFTSYALNNAFAREYVTPPTSRTSANVPWIPDDQMEYCVKIYNEAGWLEEEISSTYVDRYNQYSVNAYNEKVNRHSNMINYFNAHCAGKQSESAYKAAQKLNKEQQNIN